jgi:hypothetical protein
MTVLVLALLTTAGVSFRPGIDPVVGEGTLAWASGRE